MKKYKDTYTYNQDDFDALYVKYSSPDYGWIKENRKARIIGFIVEDLIIKCIIDANPLLKIEVIDESKRKNQGAGDFKIGKKIFDVKSLDVNSDNNKRFSVTKKHILDNLRITNLLFVTIDKPHNKLIIIASVPVEEFLSLPKIDNGSYWLLSLKYLI